jgi:hypothetical protein
MKRVDRVSSVSNELVDTHPTDAAMTKVMAGIKLVMAVAMDDEPRFTPW